MASIHREGNSFFDERIIASLPRRRRDLPCPVAGRADWRATEHDMGLCSQDICPMHQQEDTEKSTEPQKHSALFASDPLDDRERTGEMYAGSGRSDA